MMKGPKDPVGHPVGITSPAGVCSAPVGCGGGKPPPGAPGVPSAPPSEPLTTPVAALTAPVAPVALVSEVIPVDTDDPLCTV